MTQIHPERATIIFDGDCGICTKFSEIARKWDTRDTFDIVAYHELPESELERYGLTYEHCQNHMQVIDETGRVFAGANGVNFIGARIGPLQYFVGLLYVFPLFLLLEWIGYELVARNRTKVSSALGLTACRLPAPEKN